MEAAVQLWAGVERLVSFCCDKTGVGEIAPRGSWKAGFFAREAGARGDAVFRNFRPLLASLPRYLSQFAFLCSGVGIGGCFGISSL
jgi:hypothetical protein